MTRARRPGRHFIRFDASACPDPDECANLYHWSIRPGDSCGCCGTTVGGLESVDTARNARGSEPIVQVVMSLDHFKAYQEWLAGRYLQAGRIPGDGAGLPTYVVSPTDDHPGMAPSPNSSPESDDPSAWNGNQLMNTATWLHRLRGELPEWHVWFSGGGGKTGRGWYGVPAPARVTHTNALALPNRIGPFPTPQDLRAACQERYGWNETCETCGVLARDCGHRQPEKRVRP